MAENAFMVHSLTVLAQPLFIAAGLGPCLNLQGEQPLLLQHAFVLAVLAQLL
jgi:hypothetical protein